jgi:hypothetical protein
MALRSNQPRLGPDTAGFPTGAQTIRPELGSERAALHQDLAEIQHPAYPGERLIACRNLLLAEERKRKREESLSAMEKQLQKIRIATQRKRRPLRGKKRGRSGGR